MLKSPIKITIITIVILFIGINLITWGPLIFNHSERMGNELGKIYLTVGGRYQIGKQLYQTQICDTYIKNGCLIGTLKGFKSIDNGSRALIYFEIDQRNVQKSVYRNSYEYQLFGKYDLRQVDTLENLPKFALLGNTADLFTDKNLDILAEPIKKQFQELEKNPTIIIYGVDYTK